MENRDFDDAECPVLRCLPTEYFPITAQHIRERQESYEQFLEPHISTTATPIKIRFRGEEFYLNVSDDLPMTVAEALEATYRFDDGVATGDLDKVVQGIAGFSHHSLKLAERWMFGITAWDGLRRHRGYAEAQREKARRPHDELTKHWPEIRKEIDRLAKPPSSLYAACDRVASRLREGTLLPNVPVINRTGSALVKRYKREVA